MLIWTYIASWKHGDMIISCDGPGELDAALVNAMASNNSAEANLTREGILSIMPGPIFPTEDSFIKWVESYLTMQELAIRAAGGEVKAITDDQGEFKVVGMVVKKKPTFGGDTPGSMPHTANRP